MLCSAIECSIVAGFCADLTAAGAMRKPYAMLCSAVECSILAGFCAGLTAAGAMRKPHAMLMFSCRMLHFGWILR